MKPAPFQYYAPTTVEEALEYLARYGYEAKLLAGGQSLIPTMNFRLAQTALLIDINGLSDLAYIRPTDDGGLRLGGLTRQRTLERDPGLAFAYGAYAFIDEKGRRPTEVPRRAPGADRRLRRRGRGRVGRRPGCVAPRVDGAPRRDRVLVA